MIRAYQPKDLDRIMEIWLDSNLKAHDFIDSNYWYQHEQMVRNQMPDADLYVFEDQGSIKGLIGIVEGGYIAGIFVKESAQSMGIGKALLDHCKKRYLTLSLHVYEKNQRAVRFYQREGFTIVKSQIEENTQEHEYFMFWKEHKE